MSSEVTKREQWYEMVSLELLQKNYITHLSKKFTSAICI